MEIVYAVALQMRLPAMSPAGPNGEGDPREEKVNVSDPGLPAGQTIGVDVDRDGDYDIKVTSARSAAKGAAAGNEGGRK